VSYRGDIALGATIDVKFTTRRFSTGAPHTLAGSPAVAAYVDNGTTEITAGITLSVDFDSRTGLNNVRVVATSGNGFAAGTNVDLVITAGTVDSVSVVGEVIGSFSIENRSALRPTTAGRTLDVSSGGEAGLDWANIGSPTTTVGLSGTTVKTATDVETDTADIQTRLPAALVGGRIDANVGAISSDSTAADNAEAFFDGTGYAGTNNVIPTVTTLTNAPSDSSGVTTLLSRVPSGLFTGITSLAQWLGLLAGKQTGNSTARTELRATGAGSGTFDETTDSTEALRDRGDAAWTTATGFSTHTAADVWAVGTRTLTSFGTLASDAATAVWAAGTRTLTSFGTLVSDIWSNATRLLTAGTNIVLAKGTGVTGFNDLDAAGVRSAVGLASANLDTQLSAIATDAARLTSGRAGKLDSLTFTIAGHVDANIQRVNDVVVIGSGETGDEWGPA
jgi:hypothetical protein